MEKSTYPQAAISEKSRKLYQMAGRIVLTGVLVSVVVWGAMPGPMSAEAQSQLSYTPVTLNAGSNPSAARIGDLDGDGRNDIAVVNLQGSLQLFFNNGGGSFTRVSLSGLWPSGSNTFDIDLGDLNGDGRTDIAVAFATQTGSISILFNLGNRTFSSPANHSLCSFSEGVAIGDLDQDGDNDLADISHCNKASILLNDGHGNFGLKGSFGSGASSRSIALADFNGDGSKDIAYVNNVPDANSGVTVLMNNGNATFGAPQLYWVWEMPDDLAVGDFDNDGDVDIAVANSYYSLVFFLLNGGDGDFNDGYSEIPGGNAPTGIAAADFNADGRLDYALISWSASWLSLFINQGYYVYDGPIFNVGQSPVDIAAGRLDDDSLPDLVTVNHGSGTITVLLSSVSAPPPPPPPSADQITLSVSTRKTRTERLVDLRWNGASSSSVDIYRNGSRRATVSNSGSYTDRMSRSARGTFRYKVCVAGGQVCSNEAAISF